MAKRISQRRVDPETGSADFVIITALEEERDAVLAKLGRATKLDKEPSDVHTYYRASVRSTRKDRAKYDVIVTCLSNMGPTEAAIRAAMVAERWNPKYVLLVGIACGVRGEAEHGDILIATQVADYTVGKQADGRREIRWNVAPCGVSLLDSAINLSSKWQRQISWERPAGGQPQLRKGVVASGGDVIADDKVIAAYSDNWPKLIGLEMEAGGIAGALHQRVDPPEFLMIKAVSDFGSDKHDPTVVQWRAYACHAAAAFARGIIESGPAAKAVVLPEEDDDEEERAAERRWAYLQRSRLLGLEVLLILKGEVGQDWLRRILDDTRVRFSRDGDSFALSEALSLSPPPNTKEHSPRWPEAVCFFWQKYEADPSFWVCRIAKEPAAQPIVAGFSASIPWAALNLPSVITLGDLAPLSDIGMGIPPEGFMPGVEEFKLTFVGDQFSFVLRLSEHGLEFLHEMASVHFQVATPGKAAPLSLGTGFSGIQLLEMFREQLLPAWRRRENKPGSIFGGMGGRDGSISFYPAMPLDFHRSEEAKTYTVTLSGVPNTDWTKARIAQLEGAISEGTADTEALCELVARYAVSGRLLDALRCLASNVGKVAASGALFGLWGDVLRKLGRLEEALVKLQEGEKLDPDDAGIQSALAVCLSELNRDEEAYLRFEAAARLDPASARHQVNLGRSFAVRDDYPAAIKHFERAVELAPDDAETLIFLGLLYDHVDQPKEAEARFRAAAEIAPDDPKAHENLGRHFALVGDHERAIPSLSRAIEIEESTRCYELLGASLADLLRWPEAEETFRKAAAFAPEHPGLLTNLGICVCNQGRITEAIEMFERVLELSPGDSKATEILAELRG
jgi:Flp pilus assembly protein TadD/nucleoside phosphorylase